MKSGQANLTNLLILYFLRYFVLGSLYNSLPITAIFREKKSKITTYINLQNYV